MKLLKFQEGGTAPAAPAAPAQQAGPEEQVAQMAQQIVGQLGPEAAAMLAEMIMQLIQGQGQQAQPQFARKGGKLTMIRK